jgi:transcriptional regulator with XRE-family HTH domain
MQNTLHRTKKGEHVITALRKIIGVRGKEVRERLGLAPDTIKSITSGRLAFSKAAAATVADKTGVSFSWLMENDARKPPTTQTGEPFNEQTFNRHRMAHDKAAGALGRANQRGNETFRLFVLLTIKLGRVLLAAHGGTEAQPKGDARFAAWAIRDELVRLGKMYPSFDTNRKVYSGQVQLRSIPEKFDVELQALMQSYGEPKAKAKPGGKKPARVKPLVVWREVAERFSRGLSQLERGQAARRG